MPGDTNEKHLMFFHLYHMALVMIRGVLVFYSNAFMFANFGYEQQFMSNLFQLFSCG